MYVDNYKKARDLCQVAVDTSNVEEENGKRKRTSTQTVFSDYDQSDGIYIYLFF